MDELKTGNPVFDYRAGFRRRAHALQNVLMQVGLLQMMAGGVAALFLDEKLQAALLIASACGAGFVFAGIAWGFYWRNKLRADFRAQFGPK